MPSEDSCFFCFTNLCLDFERRAPLSNNDSLSERTQAEFPSLPPLFWIKKLDSPTENKGDEQYLSPWVTALPSKARLRLKDIANNSSFLSSHWWKPWVALTLYREEGIKKKEQWCSGIVIYNNAAGGWCCQLGTNERLADETRKKKSCQSGRQTKEKNRGNRKNTCVHRHSGDLSKEQEYERCVFTPVHRRVR